MRGRAAMLRAARRMAPGAVVASLVASLMAASLIGGFM